MYSPLPDPLEIATARRHATIGLPSPSTASTERRFPLTPEGVGMLVERGFEIKIEKGAPQSIHYTDERYTSQGAQIVSRVETLDCDIVISLSPLSALDARQIRRGALLMTLLLPALQNPVALEALLNRQVTSIALDLIEDSDGHTPFADILAEIDGRAAIALGASMLADPVVGKGILLGGVAGIIPCEATIIGSGIAARAAARCAGGLGAVVRMFDNDVYRLRKAVHDLGPWVVGSALHPHVLEGAIRSADIIVITPTPQMPIVFDVSIVKAMKQGAVIFDLTNNPGRTIPSLPVVDAAALTPSRTVSTLSRCCIAAPGATVARTAAMALSTSLVTFFDRLALSRNESFTDALRRSPGLRKSVYTFRGHLVNAKIAHIAKGRIIDINIYLTLS